MKKNRILKRSIIVVVVLLVGVAFGLMKKSNTPEEISAGDFQSLEVRASDGKFDTDLFSFSYQSSYNLDIPEEQANFSCSNYFSASLRNTSLSKVSYSQYDKRYPEISINGRSIDCDPGGWLVEPSTPSENSVYDLLVGEYGFSKSQAQLTLVFPAIEKYTTYDDGVPVKDSSYLIDACADTTIEKTQQLFYIKQQGCRSPGQILAEDYYIIPNKDSGEVIIFQVPEKVYDKEMSNIINSFKWK